MPEKSPLKILSIAHGAVSRDIGRLRYRSFAGRTDLSVDLVGPARWREYGREMIAEPPERGDVRLHMEPIRLPYVPAVNWYAHHYPGLSRLVRQLRPDVIHLWEEPWSFVALQAAKLRGDAALVLEVDQNILKRLPPPFEQIRRYVLERTDAILVRSPQAESVVRACGFTGPTFPIGYGVDQNLFRPAARPLQRDGNTLRAGYVGRLCEEKGLDDALDALALAKCPVELAIMGEGPYEEYLRQRIVDLGLSGRVSIQGWSVLPEVANFIQGLDVSLLLSRATKSWKEQFGRTIIESQSCGVPVIGSRSGAIPNVIAAGGWLVDERDPRGIANILGQISRCPDDLRQKSAAALANVEARFTYAETGRQLEKAWRAANLARKEMAPARLKKSAPPSVSAPRTVEDPEGFRIVQVVRDMIEGGGVEMVAYELARAWQRAGIESLAITRRTGAHRDRLNRTEMVATAVAKVKTRGIMRYVGRLIVVPAFTIAATWALRRHRHAIVLSHGDSLSGDVLVVHAVNAASIAAKRKSGSCKWMLNPMHAWAALRDRYMVDGLRFRRFIAVSRRTGQELVDYHGVPPDLITVIPNGIDLERFKPDSEARRRIRQEFGIGDNDKVLLFVGHEFERKGLAPVIAALQWLKAGTKLLIVGSDAPAPYQRMHTGAPEALIFAGERLDMPAFYAAADAFVMPSQYEACALVGMEAMASGLPVFGTLIGGIEDYLKDGVNGYAVERDGADIAAKIAPVLEDPEALARLGSGARETARGYTWDIIAARYSEVLREVWKEKRASAVRRNPSSADSPLHVKERMRVSPGE